MMQSVLSSAVVVRVEMLEVYRTLNETERHHIHHVRFLNADWRINRAEVQQGQFQFISIPQFREFRK